MKLSKSRIACYTQCPMKYRLRYLDDITVPATPAMIEGSALHAIVEAGLRAEDISRASNDYWSTLSLFDTAYANDQSMEEAKVKVLGEARRFLELIGPLNVYDVETYMEGHLTNPVTGEVDFGIVLHGYADLLIADDTGTRVVDIKTSARTPSVSAADRSIDLDVYGALFTQTFGHNDVDADLLYLVRTREPKTLWLRSYRDPFDFQRLFETVQQVHYGITHELFWRSPSMLCASCPYCGLCFENCHADRKVA